MLSNPMMTFPYWAAHVLAWLATLILFLAARHLRCRGRTINLPPGPKPWPIIGNLNLIGSLPHRSIHDLSRKYGPIMQLRFGSFPVVVASSVEMAREFLKTHDAVFASRPGMASGKYTMYDSSDMFWSPEGPYWRQARKMFRTELFSPRRVESFEYIRAEETKSMLRCLFESAGEDVPLKSYLSDLSLNIISRMVLGRKYLQRSDADDNAIVSPEEFRKMIDELFFLNGALNISDSIPWLEILDPQGYIERMKVVSKKFDQFLEHVLDEHESRMKGMEDYVAKDMVDLLLQLAKDPNLEVKIERHGVKALTLDLIAGGTESSSMTVEWAMSELLKNPGILRKAMQELESVIGRQRWVEEKDISNLPYIEAIVKETMRLHPVAPLLTPRMAKENCKIAGYDIKKGTRALVSSWSIGLDPTLWENPEEFRPERFNETDIDVNGHDFRYLPFGSGRRICPGYAQGFKVIRSSLANLLQGFNWELGGKLKREDLDMEEIFGLSTIRKNPLKVVVEPRLPPEMYAM